MSSMNAVLRAIQPMRLSSSVLAAFIALHCQECSSPRLLMLPVSSHVSVCVYVHVRIARNAAAQGY